MNPNEDVLCTMTKQVFLKGGRRLMSSLDYLISGPEVTGGWTHSVDGGWKLPIASLK